MNDLQTLQHLLRHLNNFPKLRQNALVVSLRARSGLAGHALQARVRTIVAEALEETVRLHSIEHGVERAARWQMIIQRCDLNGEHYEQVAADLGLGRRQFYQERRAAQESLAGALMEALDGSVKPALVVPSDVELQIETAIALRMRGHPEQTIPFLECIATCNSDPIHRLAAMTELAEAYEALGRTEKLSALLDAARRLAYEAGYASPALETETLMIEALLTHQQRLSDRYVLALERVHRRLARTNAQAGTRDSELALRTSLSLALEYHYVGNPQGMHVYLASARNICDRGGMIRPEHYAGYLILEGELAGLRGDLHSAIRVQRQCLAFSRLNGLPLHTQVASHNLSVSYLHGRQYEMARKHGQNALALYDMVPENPSFQLQSLLCYIEIETGHPTKALEIVRDTRQRFRSNGGYDFNIAFAEALERSGRGQEALDVLQSVSTDIEHRGWLRFLGQVERLRAAAYFGLERRSEARRALDNAMQIIEEHGSIYARSRVYELSVRITRDPIHRRRAREIRAQLAL
jgi:tetratricopeptide (TPR) repeat protein